MPADETIRLEPFAPAHLQAVAELGPDPEVQRYTYVPSPWQEGFERTWLERYERGLEDGTRAAFAIVDQATGDCLGLIMLATIDRAGRQAEAGYVVAPQARGRGVAARALRLLTDWALNELSLERIELRIATDNVGSMRVADRCGYVQEGVLRSVHFKQGLRNDLAVYSRLASD